MGDPSTPDENWGSWNCSRTDGPLGAPCVLPRPGVQFNRNFARLCIGPYLGNFSWRFYEVPVKDGSSGLIGGLS